MKIRIGKPRAMSVFPTRVEEVTEVVLDEHVSDEPCDHIEHNGTVCDFGMKRACIVCGRTVPEYEMHKRGMPPVESDDVRYLGRAYRVSDGTIRIIRW